MKQFTATTIHKNLSWFTTSLVLTTTVVVAISSHYSDATGLDQILGASFQTANKLGLSQWFLDDNNPEALIQFNLVTRHQHENRSRKFRRRPSSQCCQSLLTEKRSVVVFGSKFFVTEKVFDFLSCCAATAGGGGGGIVFAIIIIESNTFPLLPTGRFLNWMNSFHSEMVVAVEDEQCNERKRNY